MIGSPHVRLILALGLLATGGPLLAQDAGSKDKPDTLSIPVSEAQAEQEHIEQERANEEQAAFAARQLEQNQQGREDYNREVTEREALIRRQAAEHEAAMLAWEADNQRRAREHEEEMARWRADVAACEAGDTTRCAPVPAPTPGKPK